MSAVAIDRTSGTTAANEMFVLEPVAQRLGLAPFVLSQGSISIGSGAGCDIQLQVPGVQELHCVLERTRGRVLIRALDRRTWQNDLPITESWLRLGDRLAVGAVEFRVRAVEPWDLLPAVESVHPISEIAPTPAHSEFSATNADARHSEVEAGFREQIAALEADVARHQAAVVRLEQQAAATESANAADLRSQPATAEIDDRFEPVDLPATMLVVPTVPRPPVLDEHHEQLLQAIEATYRESNQKLAELTFREHALQRQLVELDSQWEQLRSRAAQQEQSDVESHQLRQELSLRQQRCELREAELESQAAIQKSQAEALTRGQLAIERTDAELQQQTQQLDAVRADLAARQQELELAATEQTARRQAEDGRLADQWRLLKDGEHAATAWSGELEERQTHLHDERVSFEHRRVELEQLEESHRQKTREAETQWQEWRQSRETEEAVLAQRRAELETLQSQHAAKSAELAEQAALQASQAAELALTRLEWEHQKALLWEESQQLEADRTRLDATARELDAQKAANEQRAAELAAQAALQDANAAELSQAQLDWEQQKARLRQDAKQVEADRVQLAERQQELDAQATRNVQRAAELAEQAALQVAQASDLLRERSEWEPLQARLSQDAQQLQADRLELDARRVELDAQATRNAQRAAELVQQAAIHTSQADELARAQLELEQQKALLSRESQHLAEGRAELDLRIRDVESRALRQESLAAKLDQRQQEFDAQVSELQDEQQQLSAERERLTAWSVELADTEQDLAVEMAGLSHARTELIAARNELDRIEIEIDDCESQLADEEALLTAREVALTQSEINCAWQARNWELTALNPRPVPGASARDEELFSETLSQTIEHISAERDALATELFTLSLESDVVADQRCETPLSVSHQTAERHRERELWQQQVDQLTADQNALQAERQALLRDRQSFEQERQNQLTQWNARQVELVAQSEQLQAAGNALRLREQEFETKWQNLTIEQESVQQLIDFLQTRHGELAQLRQDLEGQLVEASAQAARQQAEAESRMADFQERELELAARTAALAEQEANWQAAQLELQQQRQVAELERADWAHYQESQAEPDVDSPHSSPALDTIADLEEMVQDELDHDRFPVEEELDAGDWNPAKDGADDRDELPDVTHGGFDNEPLDAEPAAETDEDLTASDLRAKLAEMFNLDLSKPAEMPASATPQPDSFSFDFDETRADETAEVQAPQPDRSLSAAAVAEPDAEEYDSVESYMQRLMDRNRLSREGLELSRENHAPSRAPAAADMVSLRPVDVTPVEKHPEEIPVAVDSEPEPSRAPAIRPAVDQLKVRAGLKSLRQVANDSARSAIARSKWNKMRTRLFIEGTLAGACGLIGSAIVAGRWLEFIGTSLWGWIAIVMGVGLGIRILLSVLSIYDVNQIERAPDEQQPATAETSPEA